MEKHILVTNDDGVLAPGLLALAQEMRKLGKVSILAPDRNWSGGGHVKTLDRALRVKEYRLADGSTAFASDGAPSDCVSLGVLGFFKEKIDLVVSGVNHGANLGDSNGHITANPTQNHGGSGFFVFDTFGPGPSCTHNVPVNVSSVGGHSHGGQTGGAGGQTSFALGSPSFDPTPTYTGLLKIMRIK